MGTILTVSQYIESKTTLREKIESIDNLISQMELQALDAIGTSGTASYSVDDGQMKVSTEYRSMDDISKAINSLEKIKQRYINRHNGSVMILRSKSNYKY